MKRNKTNKKLKKRTIVKPIVMLTISLILVFIVNNGLSKIYGIVDNMSQRIRSRTIYINLTPKSYDDKIDELEKYIEENDNILDYAECYFSIGVDGCERTHDIWCVAPYMKDVMKDYMDDTPSDLEDDEIIIPKYITEGSDNTLVGDTTYIDGEQFVGDVVTVSVEKTGFLTGEQMGTTEYTFKIAGVYDSVAAGNKGDAYVSKYMAKKISENYTYVPEKFLEDEKMYTYQPLIDIRLVVDKYENIEVIQSEIDELLYDDEYGEELYMVQHEFKIHESAIFMIEGVRLVCNFLSAYLVINAIISMLLYIKETMENRRREFGILKAIGYTTPQISLEIGKDIVWIMIVPLAITLGLGVFGIALFNGYIDSNVSVYWQSMKMSAMNLTTVIIILVAVLVPLIGQWMAVKKISKLEPMEAMR